MQQDFSTFWNFTIITIDKNPVTVGKLAIALAILLVGTISAKLIIRTIGNRLLTKTPLKRNSALAIQKMFAYSVYVLILLFALRIVNIPIAAFAFLGGAIAIGILTIRRADSGPKIS